MLPDIEVISNVTACWSLPQCVLISCLTPWCPLLQVFSSALLTTTSLLIHSLHGHCLKLYLPAFQMQGHQDNVSVL